MFRKKNLIQNGYAARKGQTNTWKSLFGKREEKKDHFEGTDDRILLKLIIKCGLTVS